MGLCDFPPGTDFAPPLQLFLHQGLVGRVDQGVVLQQVCTRKSFTPKVFRLGEDRLVQDFFGYLVVTGLRIADKIDDVDNARTVLGCPVRRLAARQKGGEGDNGEKPIDIHIIETVYYSSGCCPSWAFHMQGVILMSVKTAVKEDSSGEQA